MTSTPSAASPIGHPTEQATTPALEVSAVASKHALLVDAALMRYRSQSPAPQRLEGVLALPANHEALTEAERTKSALLLAGGLMSIMGGGAASVAVLSQTGSPVAMLAGFALSVAAFVRCFRADMATSERAAERVDACALTVPGPVAEAYRRIQSAVAEIETDHAHATGDSDHDAETIATARLVAEGARDIAIRIAEHHSAGTFHTAPAEALAGEMYRLAAEMDAYLTIRNADRFAPAEAEALTLVSTTSQFTFTPALDTPVTT